MNMTNLAFNQYLSLVPIDVCEKNDNRNFRLPKYNKDGTIKKTHSNKQEGEKSEVYAFKTQEEIDSIINVLNKRIKFSISDVSRKKAYRDKLLVLVGMNIGLRASDLCCIKWSFFFKDLEGNMNDSYSIKPQKTKKANKYVTIYFNEAVKQIVNKYVAEYPINNLDEYVFLSSNRMNDHIIPVTVHHLIKDIASEAGIQQNIGSHSLRKTWGFWRWHEAEDKERALVILQQCFSHTSMATTRRYIGLLDEEISDMYNSVNLGLEIM